jgi:hypothetical protein
MAGTACRAGPTGAPAGIGALGTLGALEDVIEEDAHTLED